MKKNTYSGLILFFTCIFLLTGCGMPPEQPLSEIIANTIQNNPKPIDRESFTNSMDEKLSGIMNGEESTLHMNMKARIEIDHTKDLVHLKGEGTFMGRTLPIENYMINNQYYIKTGRETWEKERTPSLSMDESPFSKYIPSLASLNEADLEKVQLNRTSRHYIMTIPLEVLLDSHLKPQYDTASITQFFESQSDMQVYRDEERIKDFNLKIYIDHKTYQVNQIVRTIQVTIPTDHKHLLYERIDKADIKEPSSNDLEIPQELDSSTF
ncbi:hypothetical protein IC620_07045 [Hazenella sp. IB182357]|uniref:Lipoprotein n=1 Tax=Polycladospora coralii TaxID=2771432 RepID=A0A926N6I2_9BACL|nr:hypothetical protein [Polycladospora coralii]MBD1372116.1 hypothetical protein [Polycladospora coralii]MBS7530622.1 hypothetical protein [Polycladospora coralii]